MSEDVLESDAEDNDTAAAGSVKFRLKCCCAPNRLSRISPIGERRTSVLKVSRSPMELGVKGQNTAIKQTLCGG